MYRIRNSDWSLDQDHMGAVPAAAILLHDGIEPEMLANASFFAALSDLVATYGEDAVAKMTEGLSRRIHNGEFTLYRVTQ